MYFGGNEEILATLVGEILTSANHIVYISLKTVFLLFWAEVVHDQLEELVAVINMSNTNKLPDMNLHQLIDRHWEEEHWAIRRLG